MRQPSPSPKENHGYNYVLSDAKKKPRFQNNPLINKSDTQDIDIFESEKDIFQDFDVLESIDKTSDRSISMSAKRGKTPSKSASHRGRLSDMKSASRKNNVIVL
jgi:hypothetical protein